MSWEEKTAGAMEGIWGQVLWAVKQWDEMKAFQKELDAAPHTPTPQPTNSCPQEKDQNNFLWDETRAVT